MRKKLTAKTYNTVLCALIAVLLLANVVLTLCIGDIHNEGMRIERFRFASLRSMTSSFITHAARFFSGDTDDFIESGLEVFDSHRWKGPVLSRSRGTVQGPSGKETYYNLNMSGVVSIMRRLGYDYEYWVRNDGVKMYGKYVMVAANLDIRPKGSLVETSLGMGMVCDTGTFAKRNPTQIDIATAW